MGIIRILPDALRNKISAGEVVERPASVVKELVENSIDSGAKKITVEVRKAGRVLISVSDDGAGMSEQDARLCVMPHATSKLESEESLFNIDTMGFRGEALPSIASVSKMRITTAERGMSEGVSLEIKGGEPMDAKGAPSIGTTVEVHDLFYNTPARKKFLKRDSTEMLHIVDALTRLSISHPEVGFVLVADGAETISLPRASGPRERLVQIYGMEFVSELIEAVGGSGGYRMAAYVSSPAHMRENKSNQHIFINRRPVKDASVAHAVYGAYEGLAPRDQHPVFFLFIDMPPGEVDFNVHPAKREVRFSHKESVYTLVRRGLTEALREHRMRQMGSDVATSSMETKDSGASSGQSHTYASGPVDAASDVIYAVAESLPLGYASDLQHLYIGETFVAYTEGGALWLLDHHAAHERVLYEKMLAGMRQQSHMLLFPRQVELSRREHMIAIEHREALMDFGIEVEDFGQDTVMVRSLPPELEPGDIRGILADACAAVSEGERPGRSMREEMAARIACHASIRGSKAIGRQELARLLADLRECHAPEHCPHGRPTRIRLGMGELRKMFKRS